MNWALDGDKLTIFGTYNDVRGSNVTPMLIPPTSQKGSGAQLSPIWDSAVREIRTATRIIVIGYSIPATDLHFKYLLAAGLQDNISLRKLILVNPQSEVVKQRLFEIVRPENEERDVVEIAPRGHASDFFLHEAETFARKPEAGVVLIGGLRPITP